MSKLYKYQKVTDQYTTYTLLMPNNIDNEHEPVLTELGTIAGETYVLIPEDVELSENQPEQISESIVYIGNDYDKEKLFSNFKLTKNQDNSSILIATALNQDVGMYIYGYYDAGTQQTLQAMLQIDDVPDETKTLIKSIFPWIQSCLGYYYTKKTEVLEAEVPELITWDFSQFNATKPNVSLEAFMGAR